MMEVFGISFDPRLSQQMELSNQPSKRPANDDTGGSVVIVRDNDT